MDWTAIGCAMTTIGMTGGMFAYFWSRLDKKFDRIDERFDRIDERFDRIEKDIRSIDNRLSRLEGQDEERFRNEVRMIAGKH